MTSPSEPRTQPQLYHAPLAGAVWITVGGILTIYVLQLALGPIVGGLGAAAIGYGVLTVELVLASRAAGFSLGLARPHIRFVMAAILIGAACWYLDLHLVSWVVPPGSQHPEKLQSIVESSPLAAALAAIAMLPAVCEELLFRGVLLRGLASRGPVLAVVVSALVFSAYHLQPPQMLATFPLGLALGVLAVRSRSIVPGMIAHFLNNAVVLVVAQLHVTDPYPVAMLAGAGVFVAGGLALALTDAP
jgi:sodium transport system permease protein